MIYDTTATAEIAHTDKRKIVANGGNYVTRSFPTKRLKAESLFWITGHEVGHVLFSDFIQLSLFNSSITSGRMYPNFPDDLDFADQLALDGLKKYMANKDEVAVKVTRKAAATINNIPADNYIEAKMCEAFPSLIRTGILLVDVRLGEMVPNIQKQIDLGSHPYAIMINLILQYSRMGDVNNLGDYTGEYLDALDKCTPIVDDAIVADGKERFDGANWLMLKIWKYIKNMMDWVRDQMKETGKSADEILGDLDETLESQIANGASGPSGGGKGVPSANKIIPDKGSMAHDRGEIEDVLAQETDRIAPTKTESIQDEGDGGEVQNGAYTGTGYANAGADISRLLNSIAEERVEARVEEDLSKELQQEADKVRLGNAHRGIRLIINRMTDVDEDLAKQYQEVAPPLIHLARQMRQRIAQHLMDEQAGGKLTGRFMGWHLETRKLYRDDGRMFYSNKLPQEEMRLAIALLNDESGSMCGYARATTARAASIMLCRSLKIPILVYSHTNYEDDSCDLFAYAEFDSVDDKDKLRMMDISAWVGNRDEAALRYVCERLLQRPEEKKS